MDNDEPTRRTTIADAAGTGPSSPSAAEDSRAKRAAAYAQEGARILDLGCGAMALERYLPAGCSYQPCDMVARDARTSVCDFNAGEFPEGVECDLVFALGVLEYLADVPGFLAKLRALGKPAILSYSVTDREGPSDRRALGWINDYTEAQLLGLMAAAGMPAYLGALLENGQIIVRAEPRPISAPGTVAGDARLATERLAARMIPAYALVLEVGAEASLPTAFRPIGSRFAAARTVPAQSDADIVLMLNAHRGSADAVLGAVRGLGKPLICTWTATGADDPALTPLRRGMSEAGFRLQCAQQPAPAIGLFKWVPDCAAEQPPGTGAVKRVLVMSHLNTANFGDRLGYHVLNSLLPADAEVTFGTFEPWTVPERDYDLFILGIGTSLLVNDACHPKLAEILERVPKAVGIFGTQYRYQFQHPVGVRVLDGILSKLTTWWARYEEDVLAFGRGRSNVRHLGDWLITAFPMASPTINKSLTIPFIIEGKEMPLDRMIQAIQAYRGVDSARLHTLLCALTSAEEVAYREQTNEGESHQESGKFRSLLYDIFGQTFEAGEAIRVDREAVRRYRRKVDANLIALRAELHRLLA